MKNNKPNKKVTLFIWCVIVVVLWQVHENSRIEVDIPSNNGENIKLVMPLKDRRDLKFLFYKMFIREEGGYTLFGAKPMHMNGYINPFAASTWRDFSHGMSLDSLRTYRGWKAYQKYKHLFETSNFLFLAERNPFWEEQCTQSNRSNPARSILIINKEKFREVFESHKKDFQTVLGTKNISYKELLLDMKHKPLKII